MSIIFEWLILAVAFYVTAALLGGVQIKSFGNALFAAAAFGIVNFFLGWFFFVVLGIATLGVAWLLAFITRVIVDAIILKITDGLTDAIKIEGFSTALIAALAISFFGTVGQYMFGLI